MMDNAKFLNLESSLERKLESWQKDYGEQGNNEMEEAINGWMWMGKGHTQSQTVIHRSIRR